MAFSFRRAALAVATLLAVVGIAEGAQGTDPAVPRPIAVVQAGTVHALTTVVPRSDPRAAPMRPVPLPPRAVRPKTPRRALPALAARTRPPRRPAFTPAAAQQRGAQALASLHRPVARGWTVQFAVYQGRNVGFADASTKVVTLWVKPTDSQQGLRITLAHELGHVLDFTRLTQAGRADYLELRGRAGHSGTWYPCNGCDDYDSAAGDFAEVYAYWLAGAGDFRSRFAPAPDSAQLQRLGAFFTQLERAPAP